MRALIIAFMLLAFMSRENLNARPTKIQACFEELSEVLVEESGIDFEAGALASFEPLSVEVRERLEKLAQGTDPQEYSYAERLMLARIFERKLRAHIAAHPDRMTFWMSFIGLGKKFEKRRLAQFMKQVLRILNLSERSYLSFERPLEKAWNEISREDLKKIEIIILKDNENAILSESEAQDVLSFFKQLTKVLGSHLEGLEETAKLNLSDTWLNIEIERTALEFLLLKITGSKIGYLRFSEKVWKKELHTAFNESFHELTNADQRKITSFFRSGDEDFPPSLSFHRLHRRMLTKLSSSPAFYFLQLDWAFGSDKALRAFAKKDEVVFVSERIKDFFENLLLAESQRSYPYQGDRHFEFLDYAASPILVEEAVRELQNRAETKAQIHQIQSGDFLVFVNQKHELQEDQRPILRGLFQRTEAQLKGQLSLYASLDSRKNEFSIEDLSLKAIDLALKGRFELSFLKKEPAPY